MEIYSAVCCVSSMQAYMFISVLCFQDTLTRKSAGTVMEFAKPKDGVITEFGVPKNILLEVRESQLIVILSMLILV